jgi:hypothetical protein
MLRVVLILLGTLIGAQSADPGVFTMGTSQNLPLPPGWSQLEEFIFHPDPYHQESVPRGLVRDSTAKFIEARVIPSTPRGPLLQTEKVVDFYDLQEVCPHLRGLLEKNEKTSDGVIRSAVILRTLALVCLPPDLAFAADFAKQLVGRSSSLPEFQELIGLDDALADGSDFSLLKSRMDLRFRDLDNRRQNDYQAQLEYANLQDTMNVKLNRCQRAAEQKARIIAIPDRSARIKEEIKAYLSIGYGYLEFLSGWSSRRLRRETWGEQPAQQMERAEKRELRQDVVKAFRSTMSSLAPSPGVPKENLDSLRVRCLRAIEYFGGPVSNTELQFVEKNAGLQLDPLSK